MSGRTTSSRRPPASARDLGAAPGGAPPRRKRGPHIGPVGISPLRVTLVIALLGGLGFLAYAVLVRDALQVPLMASGFAVIGLVFAAMAILALLSVIRSGREGRDGMAVMTALLGGLIAVASFMALAAAVIMSLIWSGTKGA
ncbi:MAG TPA: hypothetical protein VES19_00050 [Candidatus Limnocylindrales bacterium]|nr:hypothetical protein [Candidatus Limnocylindrales bacterium]